MSQRLINFSLPNSAGFFLPSLSSSFPSLPTHKSNLWHCIWPSLCCFFDHHSQELELPWQEAKVSVFTQGKHRFEYGLLSPEWRFFFNIYVKMQVGGKVPSKSYLFMSTIFQLSLIFTYNEDSPFPLKLFRLTVSWKYLQRNKFYFYLNFGHIYSPLWISTNSYNLEMYWNFQ